MVALLCARQAPRCHRAGCRAYRHRAPAGRAGWAGGRRRPACLAVSTDGGFRGSGGCVLRLNAAVRFMPRIATFLQLLPDDRMFAVDILSSSKRAERTCSSTAQRNRMLVSLITVGGHEEFNNHLFTFSWKDAWNRRFAAISSHCPAGIHHCRTVAVCRLRWVSGSQRRPRLSLATVWLPIRHGKLFAAPLSYRIRRSPLAVNATTSPIHDAFWHYLLVQDGEVRGASLQPVGCRTRSWQPTTRDWRGMF